MTTMKTNQVRARCSCSRYYRRDRHYNLIICPWCFKEEAAKIGVDVPVFRGRQPRRYCVECGAVFDAQRPNQDEDRDCRANEGVSFGKGFPQEVLDLIEALTFDDGLVFTKRGGGG